MTNYDKQNPAGSDIGGGISGRRRADEIRGFLKQATGAFEDAGTRKRWGAGVPECRSAGVYLHAACANIASHCCRRGVNAAKAAPSSEIPQGIL